MTRKACLITKISWGRIEVVCNEQTYTYKDCQIGPTGSKEWDWNLTGTKHNPGIQIADIAEIIDQGLEVIILTRGMQLMLNTCQETEEFLQQRNIEYYIEETKQAVDLYNKLVNEGRKVGGVFHSTC
jgi:hypothetical protein